MFHHFAIPTTDVSKSQEFYETLGLKKVGSWDRPEDTMSAIQMQHPSGWGVELVKHPSTAERYKGNVYTLHIGLVVDDIDEALKKLAEVGVEVLVPPTEGITVKRFAFVSDPSGFPVELFESK